MGPGALAQVLRHPSFGLPAAGADPNLLVGLATSDDAAVYRLSPEQAIVQTLDFFAPIVDDPFTFGAIAAANSMSDVYAMGAEMLLALNIVAFPDDLPAGILTEILAGGASKVAEAGAIVAGGHTVTDPEPKYGLCATGVVHPDRVLTKAGAQPGDRVVLTKPLGTGAITTALKQDAAHPAHAEGAIRSMLALNRGAARAAQRAGVHACTDITGFGLLGHASEMAAKSGVGLRIAAGAVPLLDGALEYAAAGRLPGGVKRNRDHFSELAVGQVRLEDGVSPELDGLLFDPETSGGLLISVAAARAEALAEACAHEGVPCWTIGTVVAGDGVLVTP